MLAESLSRSRVKWINEGLFEKYWTKPHKRKGVLVEDPKNPPKDTMAKVGTVTITIEPHVIEAIMYVVKDPKPRPTPQQAQQPRPILQYGPPNGSMPPPPTPPQTTTSAASTPAPAAPPRPISQSPVLASIPPAQASPRPQEHPALPVAAPNAVAPPVASNLTPSPSPSFQPRPHAAGGAVAPSATPPQGVRAAINPPPSNTISPGMALPASYTPGPATVAPGASMAAPVAPHSQPLAHPHTAPTSGLARPVAAPPTAHTTAPAPPPPPAQNKPSPNDPVIALLAQRASGDPTLRDLMKRVAVGQAKEGELTHFQLIIDQLNREYRSKGGQQGPSADRLIVNGRTVKYFATEVRTIIELVFASNPNQKSSDLRPPPRSDPLVVLLVKTAIEDQRTRDIIKRIADDRPGHTDATDLRDILERLHRDMKTVPQGSPAPTQQRPQQTPNGIPNGQVRAPTPQAPAQQNPQALRSKGPPPAPKPDIAAVIFDFGTGDRYLFPKFSILDYPPTATGQQVVASFLIVRKGSTSEYGGDPKLDYYEPVTIRLYTHLGRHLENLQKVVAPQEEVRRYMDDVMDNMTRAEYVLLAMRLPRTIKDGEKDGVVVEEPKTGDSTPKPVNAAEQNPPKPGVLWGVKGKSTAPTIDLTKPIQSGLSNEEEDERRYKAVIMGNSKANTDNAAQRY